MPEREPEHLTPATRLLEKKREMAEVEQALAAQKEVWLVTPLITLIIANGYVAPPMAGVSDEDGDSSAAKRRAGEKGTQAQRITA